MQISNRFPIAVQILTCIAIYEGKELTTSEFLSCSINVNPVIIRKVIQQLKAFDLITVRRGFGGASFAKSPEAITLLDVFYAVESLTDEQLFSFHSAPNRNDPVGKHIQSVLSPHLSQAQTALEKSLQSVTIADIVTDMQKRIEHDTITRQQTRSQYFL